MLVCEGAGAPLMHQLMTTAGGCVQRNSYDCAGGAGTTHGVIQDWWERPREDGCMELAGGGRNLALAGLQCVLRHYTDAGLGCRMMHLALEQQTLLSNLNARLAVVARKYMTHDQFRGVASNVLLMAAELLMPVGKRLARVDK